jgi:hypothetical protein
MDISGNGSTNYIERIIAGEEKEPAQLERLGTLADPVDFGELSEATQLLLGAHTADEARLVGLRTAEMHLALACGTGKDAQAGALLAYTISARCSPLCSRW